MPCVAQGVRTRFQGREPGPSLIPRVPGTGAARTVLWLLVGLSTLGVGLSDRFEPASPRLHGGLCEFSSDPSRPGCDCGALGAELRHVLGLPVDLNRAGLEDLTRLPGIGEIRAGQILEARAQSRFESLASLQRVWGIGAATVARLETRLYVGVDPLCAEGGEGEKRIGDPQDQKWRSTQ